MDSNSCFNSCFTKRLFLIPSIEFDLLPACIVTIPPNSSVIRLHVSLKGHEIRSCPFLSTSAGVSLHCPWIFVQIVVKSAVSGKIPIKCIASLPPSSEQNSIPGRTTIFFSFPNSCNFCIRSILEKPH